MGTIEDRMFMRLMAKAKDFEKTHRKTDIGKNCRFFIKDNYQRLKQLEPNTKMGVQCDPEWVKIRIVAKSITSCSAAPAFIALVGISDTCFIDTCKNGFIIDLSISLYHWQK